MASAVQYAEYRNSTDLRELMEKFGKMSSEALRAQLSTLKMAVPGAQETECFLSNGLCQMR